MDEQYPEFNARLEDIESKVLNTLRRLENDGKEVTHDLLKREFDKLWKDSNPRNNQKKHISRNNNPNELKFDFNKGKYPQKYHVMGGTS